MLTLQVVLHTIQDEEDLYKSAKKGDVPAVRQHIEGRVNVDCTPYQVCSIQDIYMYILVKEALLHALLQSRKELLYHEKTIHCYHYVYTLHHFLKLIEPLYIRQT